MYKKAKQNKKKRTPGTRYATEVSRAAELGG